MGIFSVPKQGQNDKKNVVFTQLRTALVYDVCITCRYQSFALV